MSDAKTPTWSVHCTADEPVELLCAYVAHHLAMGASEVHLYLDRPNPEAVAVLSQQKAVRLTLCDDSYWGQGGRPKRPAFHIGRQSINANDHYKSCTTDWSVFCDADEMVVSDRPFAEVLAELPDSVDFARIQVAERVFQKNTPPRTIFDGVFRLNLKDREADEKWAYGDTSRFLFRGVLGHNLGKTVTRTGRNRVLTPHFALPAGHPSADRSFLEWPEFLRFLDGVHLAHFDALTPTNWLFKLMKKYISLIETSPDKANVNMRSYPPGRAAQFRTAYNQRQNAEALNALKMALVLDPDTVERLRKINGIADIRLDVASDVQHYFPTTEFDYTVAAFDARLRERNAALIAETGFVG